MKNTSTTKQTIKLYAKENLAHKWMFLATNLTWSSGILLQKLLLPLIVASTFDLIIKNQANLEWSTFIGRFVLFAVVALVAQFFIDAGLVLLSRTETKVIVSLHRRIYDHLIHQSMQFHNNSFSGALVNQTNRLVNGYVTVTDTFVINVSQLVILLFFSSAILFIYSPLLAFVIVLWSILFLAINIHLTIRRISLGRARAAADSKLTGYLADSMGNIGAIKTFAAEKHELGAYNSLAHDRANKGYAYWIRTIKNDAVFGIMMSTLQVLVLTVSIYAIKNHAITISVFILAQVYITQAIANLWGLSNITKNLEQNISDAAEMTEILNQDSSVQDLPDARKIKVKDGSIAFKDVSFAHAENKDELFKQLGFSVAAGERVGLVGPSGGGKTTITKLLLRFMDIPSGEILIDGQAIDQVTQESLRQTIAYVPQEPLLFHRSLSENIAYGNPKASSAAIEKAAKLAHADEFIEQLPNRYDTLVGERGIKLSGGQRQRIAIARAMIKDAPILVLDEATSALDSESEVLIQDALWKLMEGRTAIVIAHRLSTIQKMDRIIVLKEGEIAEQGTHHELLKNNGLYAKLWAHQSGGFIDD
jgi:ATP-binding cassette subfamily B protein